MTDTDHRAEAERLSVSYPFDATEHLLAALLEGQAEQTEWLHRIRDLLAVMAEPQGDPCPCGRRRDVEPKPHVHFWKPQQNVTSRGYAMPPIEVCDCGTARRATDPEPETVTVTLPRDVVEAAERGLHAAVSALRLAGNVVDAGRIEGVEVDLNRAVDAASATQEADQGGRVAQGAGDGRVAHSWAPKSLREHLCQQQTFAPDERTRWAIQILIDLLDVHRPIGNDGKHDERHTDTCGCEDR